MASDSAFASEKDVRDYIDSATRSSNMITKFARARLEKQAELDKKVDEDFQRFKTQEEVRLQAYDYECRFRLLLDEVRVQLAKERTLHAKDESLLADKILSCLARPETCPTSKTFDFSLAYLGDVSLDHLSSKELLDWLEEVDVAHHSGREHPSHEYGRVLTVAAFADREVDVEDYWFDLRQKWVSEVPRIHRAYAKILTYLSNARILSGDDLWNLQQKTHVDITNDLNLLYLRESFTVGSRDQPSTKKIRSHIFVAFEGCRATHKRMRNRLYEHRVKSSRCRKEIEAVIALAVRMHLKRIPIESLRLNQEQQTRVCVARSGLTRNTTRWEEHAFGREYERDRDISDYIRCVDEKLDVQIATTLFHSRIVDDLRADVVFQSRHVREVLRHCSSF